MALKFSELKAGDIITKVIHAKVVDKTFSRGFHMDDAVNLTDLDTGQPLCIEGVRLIEECRTADQYIDTQAGHGKTAMAELFVGLGERPFTVCFTKANGDERILRGVLAKTENHLGRSTVRDLDITEGAPLRQVDHRTIKWLIADRTLHVAQGVDTPPVGGTRPPMPAPRPRPARVRR